jgi:signal transduction histidine kinase
MSADLGEALLAALPDGLVLCDGLLEPVRTSASARWLASEGAGWALNAAASQVRQVLAASLDRNGVASRTIQAQGRRWLARASPIDQPPAAACVIVHPLPSPANREDAVLRAAHDLKAPAHAIQGFAKLLLREEAGPLAPEQRRFLETVASEAARLRSLLELVLEVARGGEDRPASSVARAAPADAGRASLAAAAEETVARLMGLAAAREVEVKLHLAETPPVALSEREAATLVENLVLNAVHAARGGTVTLRLQSDPAGRHAGPRPSDATVVLTVEDTGPGIPEDALERVFEPYYRVMDRSAQGGTGLGLAIVRTLAEERGGSVSAANRAEGGAVFTLTLPAAQAPRSILLRLAPVASHEALAAARTALERRLAGGWRLQTWQDGVLAVEASLSPAELRAAAADIAAGTGLACWVATQRA